MKGSTLEGLINRLDRVERENRRLKRIGSAALVAVASLVLMGQAARNSAKVVEAERFVLRDASGKLRAEWAVEADGRVDLLFSDRDGNLRAGIGVAADGRPGLRLNDRDERLRAILQLEPDGTPFLRLRGRHELPARLGLAGNVEHE